MVTHRLAVGLGALTLVVPGGCADGEPEPPHELFDGAPARAVPVELERVDAPAVLTRAVARNRPAGERAATCLDEAGASASGRSVERVGVLAESVTIAGASWRALVGCDNSAGSREDGRRWCGTAYGLLSGGRLLDPRLDVLCATEGERPLGLAWMEPGADTEYVAVRLDGYVEVYEPAGGLPVRIATIDVDRARSAATFAVSEHDGSGRLLRRYELEAAVAG